MMKGLIDLKHEIYSTSYDIALQDISRGFMVALQRDPPAAVQTRLSMQCQTVTPKAMGYAAANKTLSLQETREKHQE